MMMSLLIEEVLGMPVRAGEASSAGFIEGVSRKGSWLPNTLTGSRLNYWWADS
jgi:hypothetical protein